MNRLHPPLYFLEAYDGGSHRNFAQSVLSFYKGETFYFGLPPRHWRWRLQGSHYALAQWANQNIEVDHDQKKPVFLLTSLTDAAAFRGCLKEELRQCPLVIFMHESQLEYPSNQETHTIAFQDQELLKKEVFPSLHLNQMMGSDLVVFNSHYHRESLCHGLKEFWGRRRESFNDFPLGLTDLSSILTDWERKTSVIPVGIEPPDPFPSSLRDIDLLWNHRDDYDKNPKGFIELFQKLVTSHPRIKIALLGEVKGKAFDRLRSDYSQNIAVSGFLERKDYREVLRRSKVLPLTSFHDFQGLSLLEAMSFGVIPIAPKRMVYPEQLKNFPQLLYQDQGKDQEQLLSLTRQYIEEQTSHHSLRQDLHRQTEKYWWPSIEKEWDLFWEKLEGISA